jgi:5-(aminomethyl)-3-furanmethanol phosphate kinase
MWVVKLGGSLAMSDALGLWLEAIATPSKTPVVIVPGGGPFADAVRDAQKQHGFDDAHAHRMALGAMEQYATMLCALNPRFVPAENAEAILRANRAGDVPVWMPLVIAAAATDITETWDITSDSLAAWLAAKLEAQALFLVKSLKPAFTPVTVGKLAQAGMVDAALPEMAASGAYEIRWLGPGDERAFARSLQTGEACGIAIARNE